MFYDTRGEIEISDCIIKNLTNQQDNPIFSNNGLFPPIIIPDAYKFGIGADFISFRFTLIDSFF